MKFGDGGTDSIKLSIFNSLFIW